VRFCNKASRPTSVHLHGSASVSPYDGWAEDTTPPGECKEYWVCVVLLQVHAHAYIYTCALVYVM
jgi:hypothetical protein